MSALLIPLCLTSCGGDPSVRLVPAQQQPAGGDAPFCQHDGWFLCYPWCFPAALRCDGVADCPEAEDEAQCGLDADADADPTQAGDAGPPQVSR